MYNGEGMNYKQEEKLQGIEGEMTRNAGKFSELLEGVGTANTGIESDRPGAKIAIGWEQLVNTTANEAIGNKLIVRNTAEK